MPRPAFIPPMLATLVAAPFDDPDWLFEVKWDGFRVEAVVDGGATSGSGRAARRTRRSGTSGRSSTPPTWIAAKEAIVDGEVIALDDRRRARLRPAPGADQGAGRAAAEPTPFVYEVFDLLHLDGRSLLDEPLEERRRLLARVLRPDPRVRLSEHIEGDGLAFFEAARVRGLEGIMAKDRRSPYVPGKRSDRWQKVKIRPEQELVVGGWATGTGRAVDLGALLVGVYEGGALRYAGKIGAGFTRRQPGGAAGRRRDARRGRRRRSRHRCRGPPPANAHWLRPELVIRAEFAGWTGDGLVRQAAYKGIELEKDPRKVIRERPKA